MEDLNKQVQVLKGAKITSATGVEDGSRELKLFTACFKELTVAALGNSDEIDNIENQAVLVGSVIDDITIRFDAYRSRRWFFLEIKIIDQPLVVIRFCTVVGDGGLKLTLRDEKQIVTDFANKHFTLDTSMAFSPYSVDSKKCVFRKNISGLDFEFTYLFTDNKYKGVVKMLKNEIDGIPTLDKNIRISRINPYTYFDNYKVLGESVDRYITDKKSDKYKVFHDDLTEYFNGAFDKKDG